MVALRVSGCSTSYMAGGWAVEERGAVVVGEVDRGDAGEHAPPPAAGWCARRGIAQISAAVAAANETSAAASGSESRGTRPSQSARPAASTNASPRVAAATIAVWRAESARGSRQQPVRAVARKDRAQRADQERRVRRPAVEVHARQSRVEHAEHRRVPAERIDQGHAGGAGEEADLARPQLPAHGCRNQQQQRQRADVQLAHVLGEEDAGVRPGEARRAPVVLHAARGAEHVGHHQRQQQGRMQRAARGADVVDRGTVGLSHQQGRQQHRHGDEERARTPRRPPAAARLRATPHAARPPSAGAIPPRPASR